MKDKNKRISDVVVRNYARRLSDSELNNVTALLNDKFSGDLERALLFMQKSAEMDRFLASAYDVDDFFELADIVETQLKMEQARRGDSKR